MTDTISYSGLAFALLAPWLLGSVWVYSLVSKSGRWNWFLVLGHGYFIGIFLTVSLILLWDYLGLALGFQGIAATLTVITVAGGLLSVKKAQSPRDITAPETLSRWHICVISLLLGLLFWRYSTLLQEILLRPLYSWDSWMNWAPKAIVWFHQQNSQNSYPRTNGFRNLPIRQAIPWVTMLPFPIHQRFPSFSYGVCWAPVLAITRPFIFRG